MENKNHKRRQKNFQVFLQDDEWDRFIEIYNLAKSRLNHPEIPLKKSFVIRRLVGLEAPDEVVTQEDIEYFLGRKSATRRIIRFLPPTKTEISEPQPRPAKKAAEDLIKVNK